MKYCRALINLIFIAAIFTAIAFPVYGWLQFKKPELAENRQPHEMPELHPKRNYVVVFPEKFEKYFDDHFGYRKQLLDWQHEIDRDVFSLSTNNLVWLGKGGWLYLNVNDPLRDAPVIPGAPEHPSVDDRVQEWLHVFEERAAWCRQHNIPYVLMITPEKSAIIPEHLSDFYLRHPPLNGIDLIQPYLAKSNLNYVMPQAELRQEKEESDEKLFFMYDTHWTHHGSRIGYEALCRKIAALIPDFQPQPRDAYSRHDGEHSGDLGLLLGLPKEERTEPYRFYQPKAIGITKTEPAPFHEQKSDDLVLLQNRPAVEYRLDTAAGPYLMLVHDSFSEAMIPFFTSDFKKVATIRTYDFPAKIVLAERPAIVVQQLTARTLYQARPRKQKLPQ